MTGIWPAFLGNGRVCALLGFSPTCHDSNAHPFSASSAVSELILCAVAGTEVLGDVELMGVFFAGVHSPRFAASCARHDACRSRCPLHPPLHVLAPLWEQSLESSCEEPLFDSRTHPTGLWLQSPHSKWCSSTYWRIN